MGLTLVFGCVVTNAAPVQKKRVASHDKEINRLAVNWQAADLDKKQAKAAWKKISTWVKGQPKHGKKLHVVYVTLKDRPALPDYRGRYDRMARNIQAYYADQMKENGFPPLTFDLELDKAGKVVVHDAQMEGNMADFDYHTSGGASFAAAKKALSPKGINLEEEYALIIVQMPDKKGPYYGGGNFKSGRAWICDAAHLDPLNFASQDKGEYLFKTKGNDNSVYIGGTAHELGHCFGLPHTRHMTDNSVAGSSLMGNGNYTYGNELRKEGKGTFLIQTDAMRLASLPLFTGSSKGIDDSVVGKFSHFDVKKEGKGAVVTGIVQGVPPVYAIVAYIDPAGGSDYDASAITVIPDDAGKFTLNLQRDALKGLFELRLLALHVNGATTTRRETLIADEDGLNCAPLVLTEPLAPVQEYWEKRENAKALEELESIRVKYGKDPMYLGLIAHWEKSLKAEEPMQSLAAQTGNSVSLVDVKPTEQKSGWWKPFWDTLPPNPHGPRAFFEQLVPDRFMYTHAPGVFSYHLGGNWKGFSGVVGMPMHSHGTIRFVIKGDGKELFSSDGLRDGMSKAFSVNVEGVNELSIDILKNKPEDDNSGNWGVIANPVLTK